MCVCVCVRVRKWGSQSQRGGFMCVCEWYEVRGEKWCKEGVGWGKNKGVNEAEIEIYEKKAKQSEIKQNKTKVHDTKHTNYL